MFQHILDFPNVVRDIVSGAMPVSDIPGFAFFYVVECVKDLFWVFVLIIVCFGAFKLLGI